MRGCDPHGRDEDAPAGKRELQHLGRGGVGVRVGQEADVTARRPGNELSGVGHEHVTDVLAGVPAVPLQRAGAGRPVPVGDRLQRGGPARPAPSPGHQR